jgi:fatty-acyl-CoA synthase
LRQTRRRDPQTIGVSKPTADETLIAMTPPLTRLTARNDNAAWQTTVGHLLIEWARQTPRGVAIADGGSAGGAPRVWTFEALRDDAASLAGALLSRYDPGERIALWSPSCAEAELLRFAAALAGLVLVRIDAAWPARAMARILELSGSSGLFVLVDGHRGPLDQAAEHLPPALRETVDLADRRALFAKNRSIDGLPEVRPDDPAEIRYGAPRSQAPAGEIILHRDLAAALRRAQAVAPLRRTEDSARTERLAATA